jgi:hypothetical protein
VRGLLLPSGLEDSEDLCHDEKKRPLNTIALGPRASPGRSFVEQVGMGKRSGARRTGRACEWGQRAGNVAAISKWDWSRAEPRCQRVSLRRPASRGVRFASADGRRWAAGVHPCVRSEPRQRPRGPRPCRARDCVLTGGSGSSRLAAMGQLRWTWCLVVAQLDRSVAVAVDWGCIDQNAP